MAVLYCRSGSAVVHLCSGLSESEEPEKNRAATKIESTLVLKSRIVFRGGTGAFSLSLEVLNVRKRI
jgi:hypothetical protein